jgi:hypothetical protein
MTKFVNGEKVTFWKHVFNVEYFTKIVDDFDGIFKTELTLFDESFSGVYTDRDAFSMIPRSFGKSLDIFKVSDCICEKLLLA